MTSEPLLVDLASQVLANWQSPEMERRRRLWTGYFAGKRQDKIPVKCAVFDYYDLVWRQLIPEDTLVFREGLRRDVEVQLRIKLERFRRLPDDEVVWPTLWAQGHPRPSADSLWGVPLANVEPGMDGGAYRPVPPLNEESDLERLHGPEVVRCPAEEARLTEQISELAGGLLPVRVHTDELHYGPYEWAVRLRGADRLLLDVYDRPAWVHLLMGRITEGMVAYHQAREREGLYDAQSLLPQVHVPFDEVPAGLEARLAGGWCYAHAQSATSLSPAMYAEFVQPYNARVAKLFRRVYYHGCEDLTRKARVIRDLPNLAYFHVSPWTCLEDVVSVFSGTPVALEVHCHPTEVLFTYGPEEMRSEVRQRIAQARGTLFDLKLCDIQTIRGAEEQIERWTQIAMEESAR
jgi:hypothetical protein